MNGILLTIIFFALLIGIGIGVTWALKRWDMHPAFRTTIVIVTVIVLVAMALAHLGVPLLGPW